MDLKTKIMDMEKEYFVDKEYFAYLELLRDSGVTNMFGAAPYLEAAFGLSRNEARTVLTTWMKSFSE